MLLYGRCMPRSRTKIIGKTFRNSSAVPNRAFFSITSSVMAKLSFHVYFSNISDTAPNAAITFSTTISFFSFHSFPKFFRRIWDFPFFSSSLSFTCQSPGLTMSMIWASLACLSRKMMSGLLLSNNLITLSINEIPEYSETLTFYHSLLGMFVAIICPFQFDHPT